MKLFRRQNTSLCTRRQSIGSPKADQPARPTAGNPTVTDGNARGAARARRRQAPRLRANGSRYDLCSDRVGLSRALPCCNTRGKRRCVQTGTDRQPTAYRKHTTPRRLGFLWFDAEQSHAACVGPISCHKHVAITRKMIQIAGWRKRTEENTLGSPTNPAHVTRAQRRGML